MNSELRDLPALPLDEWEETRWTLHLYLQIIGKIRLKLMPPQNHWWHVPLYVSSRGITTRPIPYKSGAFEIELDCVDPAVRVSTSTGIGAQFYLQGQSVAQFNQKLFSTLDDLGVDVTIVGTPFGIPITTPFAEDNEHATYDPEYVQRWWQAMLAVYGVMSEFMGRFQGKTTPVHLFWHSFDLALTRFSGRRAPTREGADPVTMEAYSHEVISFGWWPGDADTRQPMFYSYTAPEPMGLAGRPLQPEGAFWLEQSPESHTALYSYDDARVAENPRASILSFLESAYHAGAELAGWDVESLRHPRFG
jgi:hypothetical protein